MPVRLTLVSHAVTPAVRAAAFPLNESIEDASRREAVALEPRFRISGEVWAAPEARTTETAEALGLTALLEPALKDVDCGRWAGRTMRDVASEEPEALARWMTDPAFASHGGESFSQLFGRVDKWLDVAAGKRGRIVAVTHPAVVRAAIVVAIEAAPAAFWRIDVPPLAAAELRSDGRRWMLRSLGL
jgi:broad specificity phosphatase PhoE